MKAKNKLSRHSFTILLLVVFLFSSCRKEDDIIVRVPNENTKTHKIAVILPIGENSEYKKRFERTITWALSKLRTAQNLLSNKDITVVDLELEWYDETTENLTLLSSKLAQREDIYLVIGPLQNKNIDVVATACGNENKPLIVPSASSEAVIRRYAVGTAGVKNNKPFLWSLCETDVSQCEALLAKAWEGSAKKIALLSPNDEYGKTFFDWIPFQANEMGMDLLSNEQFESEFDVVNKATAALNSGAECVICITRSTKETKDVLEVRQKMEAKAPRLLFSNAALSPALVEMGSLTDGVEGVAQYADPATGFQIAYEECFGESPSGMEAQLYDAILLTGIAAFAQQFSDIKDANEIICQITSSGTKKLLIWNDVGLKSLFQQLEQGIYVEMWGASGLLRFDAQVYTSLIRSTYVHWMIYANHMITIDYASSDGSNRTSGTLASWNLEATQNQSIEDQDVNMHYQPLNDQWAVLIQGSNEWKNYRHQADVLNMYQLLKKNGYNDDHIILIVSDDVAYNTSNKKPGEIRTYTEGGNLYAGAQIDYSTDSLVVTDIIDIMTGKQSKHLPIVLQTDSQSNVLVFWSGHGCLSSSSYGQDGFIWRNSSSTFSTTMLKSLLNTMSMANQYRKLLMFFEPCYSENMIKQAEGIPGVLSFSSAGSREQSFADYHSIELGTWMSNRFSNNLVNELGRNPSLTYKDLYFYLTAHTLGSHVRVANAAKFGNLYRISPYEFFVWQKR